jgi:hypothetical protein
MTRLHRVLVAGVLAAALLFGVTSTAFVRPAQAAGIGDILKIGGVLLVVSTFGSQMNTFINNALGQREAAAAGATKVVPIFSVGRGAYIGAAQVVGLPANVRSTQGVATVQATLSRLNGSYVIPISTRRPAGGTSLSRVSGVGISAVIDLHI